MQAGLVGAQRHGRVVTLELLVATTRQRLLDELDAEFADGRTVLPKLGKAPALVDVDDEPGVGTCLPNGGDALHRTVVIELDL